MPKECEGKIKVISSIQDEGGGGATAFRCKRERTCMIRLGKADGYAAAALSVNMHFEISPVPAALCGK